MSNVRFCYKTLDFDEKIEIHVRTLKDTQQFSDKGDIALNLGINSASWPLFGVIWPSGEILAHLMHEYEIENKKILEIGCGIGLASLVLNHRQADITATDYHPEVQNFLNENTKLNGDEEIPFIHTGWADVKNLSKYDLIIGSDLLYERDHVELLSTFIQNCAKQNCEVIIVDPGRGNYSKFNKIMIGLGFSLIEKEAKNLEYLEKPFKGQILYFNR